MRCQQEIGVASSQEREIQIAECEHIGVNIHGPLKLRTTIYEVAKCERLGGPTIFGDAPLSFQRQQSVARKFGLAIDPRSRQSERFEDVSSAVVDTAERELRLWGRGE